MARPPIWPPPLRKCRGYWRARDPRSGQYKSFGPDETEARRRYAEWLATLDRPSVQRTPLGLSVAGVLDAWLAQAQLTPKERMNFDYTCNALKATHGSTPARDFDAGELEAHRAAQLGRLSARTANSRVNRIRQIWRWAEQRKLVPIGSWNHLRTLPPLRTLPRVVRTCTLVDVLKVGEHCPPPIRAILELLWWTGMRPGEARVMRGCDIDKSGELWVYRPASHKNQWRGHERAVVLCAEARKVIEPWLTDGLLFPSGDGEPYKDAMLSLLVRRAARRAGVKFTAYHCRHAFKDRVTRSHGIEHARAALGQRSLSVTDGYGTRADLSLAMEVFRGEK